MRQMSTKKDALGNGLGNGLGNLPNRLNSPMYGTYKKGPKVR